ncbi:flagellar hook-basal body protein [Vallitalea sp.]|jgi:flagellar basal-body rod protein FlgG|uniref:flagellar hook-basal body protein n=1 Tax=Vallitalea sp. TaxID=1882829 RepID=UPI0025E1538B|nr:flagellar hook-basal body protein [Vallitalea sp.]MCT4687996.1 flagellar hook-basal body protein [Vallitalea sp.]
MIRGLYTASNGMIAQQEKMDIISNNLANVNTTGFKKDGVIIESFDSVLTQKINDTSVPGNESIGKMTLGCKVGQVYTDNSQGGATPTNDPYNVAILGAGMLSIGVEDADGNLQTKYTRDGSFTVSTDGTLMTKEGNYVLGQNGKIVLPSGSDNVRISENGTIFYNDKEIDKLLLTDFENPESLRKIGDNLYKKTEETKESSFGGKIIQGYLESSNVNTVREMVDMISVMRTYEANQKVIQTQDETLKKAVNEVGRL